RRRDRAARAPRPVQEAAARRPPAPPGGPMTARRVLRVDPIACDGHGLCAELFPERIHLDDWGFPIVDDEPVPPALETHARRAGDGTPRRDDEHVVSGIATIRFESMGCEVVVAGASADEASAVERLFHARELTFSRFVPRSELNRVNACAGRPVAASRDFVSM